MLVHILAYFRNAVRYGRNPHECVHNTLAVKLGYDRNLLVLPRYLARTRPAWHLDRQFPENCLLNRQKFL